MITRPVPDKYTPVDPMLPVRPLAYGIVVSVTPADPTYNVELYRAPDDGGGNPDVGNAVLVDSRCYAAFGDVFADPLPNDYAKRFYRWRHTVAGGTAGGYTAWVWARPDFLSQTTYTPQKMSVVALSLIVRARVTATSATTVTVRVAVADPYPQGGSSATITYQDLGSGGVAPASGGTVTPEATVTEGAGTYVDYVITRPAFAAGTARVTFSAAANGRMAAVDAVDVPAVDFNAAALLAAGGYLLLNYNFESGQSYWYNLVGPSTPVTLFTSGAYEGTSCKSDSADLIDYYAPCARPTTPADSGSPLYISVRGGDTVKLRARMKIIAGHGGAPEAAVSILEYDGAHGYLRRTKVIATTSTSWTDVPGNVVTGSDARYVVLVLNCSVADDGLAPVAHCCWDNIYMLVVSSI